MRAGRPVLAAILLAASALPVLAVQPDEVMADPRLEARARTISGELRCLVCQNQSIDDSDAPLARDLRILVRDRLRAGDQDQDVREFVVSRYGEFVLLRPVVAWHTALLWLGPLLLVAAAAIGVFARVRGGRAPVTELPLSPDEERRLATLTAEAPPRG